MSGCREPGCPAPPGPPLLTCWLPVEPSSQHSLQTEWTLHKHKMTGLLLVGYCLTLIIDTLQNMHRKAILTCSLKNTAMIIHAYTTAYWETFASVLFSPLSTTLEHNTILSIGRKGKTVRMKERK